MSVLNETLKSLIRYVLGVAFGYLILPLVGKGILTGELAAQIQSHINNWAALGAATLITFFFPLVWAWWKNVVQKFKLIIALQIDPASADRHELLVEHVETTSPKTKLATVKYDEIINKKG